MDYRSHNIERAYDEELLSELAAVRAQEKQAAAEAYVPPPPALEPGAPRATDEVESLRKEAQARAAEALKVAAVKSELDTIQASAPDLTDFIVRASKL